MSNKPSIVGRAGSHVASIEENRFHGNPRHVSSYTGTCSCGWTESSKQRVRVQTSALRHLAHYRNKETGT